MTDQTPVAGTGATQAASTSVGELTIRRATRADVPGIIALFVADAHNRGSDSLAAEDMPRYFSAFETIDADARQILFVADRAGSIVGTFQITFTQNLVYRARLRATVESVHVAASLRGAGIGAAMMAHAIAVARDQGAGIMQLTSNKSRIDAHRFYERLGFRRSHEGFKLEL